MACLCFGIRARLFPLAALPCFYEILLFDVIILVLILIDFFFGVAAYIQYKRMEFNFEIVYAYCLTPRKLYIFYIKTRIKTLITNVNDRKKLAKPDRQTEIVEYTIHTPGNG